MVNCYSWIRLNANVDCDLKRDNAAFVRTYHCRASKAAYKLICAEQVWIIMIILHIWAEHCKTKQTNKNKKRRTRQADKTSLYETASKHFINFLQRLNRGA